MTSTRQISSAPRGGVVPALFVGVSLLLNVYLAAHLLDGKAAASTEVETANNLTLDGTRNPSAALETSETPDTTEPDVPTFYWSEIESADYRQYIANLRAYGVPDQVIRDILVADVNQLYIKRARNIWPQRATEYWQKYSNEKPNPKQMEELMALQKEQGALLQDLLGKRIGQQELIDMLYLQVQGSERELLLLPPEKREAALRALAAADIESKEMKLHSQSDYRGAQQKLFDEKLKLLADVLTPEEWDEFHQRNSPRGNMLKPEVRYFNLTPEEYKQLLLAKESGDERQSTKDLVRKLFGDERAKEFERVSSPFYINARTGAEAEGVPLDRVDQAARFANDTMTAAFAALQDKTFPVEERKARLKELQSQAEARIKEILGDNASKTVLRDLRNVLRSSASYIQP